MKLTSEEFASKMIEDFEEYAKPDIIPSGKEKAEEVEKAINKKIEEEVKKILPEEVVESIDDSEFQEEENNLNDESEEE